MSILAAINEIENTLENDKIRKREEYKNYIDEHIELVKKAFRVFESISWKDPHIVETLRYVRDNIEEHDQSKYSDEEFEYYRKEFYPINDDEKEENKEDFEKAWKHHYQNNFHHPEYWVDAIGNQTSMCLSAIIEMICDWQAMSFKFGGDCRSWYYSIKDTKDDKKLTNETRDKLEQLLDIYVVHGLNKQVEL